MYKCPQCGSDFEIGQAFCPNCGYNLKENFIESPICPKCHRTYPAGTQYCKEDGCKLVRQEDLKYKCEKCGKEYNENVKFCPDDGGRILPAYLIGNPSSSTSVLQKAPIGKRFLAYLIDSLIMFALAIPAGIFYGIGISMASEYDYDSSSSAVLFFILAVICYILPMAYAFIKDGLKNGQSYGKAAVNLKVINYYTKLPCTKGTSCLRNLISMVLCLIPIVGPFIEPIMVLATEDGRKLADRAANTIVVESN